VSRARAKAPRTAAPHPADQAPVPPSATLLRERIALRLLDWAQGATALAFELARVSDPGVCCSAKGLQLVTLAHELEKAGRALITEAREAAP
jgi:hypothetical protein